MRILITGANGFIGAQIAAVLSAAGHEVIRAVRGNKNFVSNAIHCDLSRDVCADIWLPRLAGIDAVVNCAGILRENRRQTFDAVHRGAPCALFDACARAGVRKVIQISALGDARDSEFIASKQRADEYLSTLDLDWTVLRPSVVYTTAGSYGGTSLLRAMAALPFVLFLPGGGGQRIQPVHAEDLAKAVLKALEQDNAKQKMLEVVGPETLSLKEFLSAQRRWLALPGPRHINMPLAVIKPVAWLGEIFSRGPLGLTMYRMLQRGNTGSADAVSLFEKTFGFRPRAMENTLQQTPSYVQDRWHARLYFLRPALRLTLAILWIASGIVGFIIPAAQSAAMLEPTGIPAWAAAPLVYTASIVDLLLGLALIFRYQVILAGILMCVSLFVYTVFIGVLLPEYWLEPFGSLLKNIPLIPAVLIMMALEDIR